jgi:hypothetical protein
MTNTTEQDAILNRIIRKSGLRSYTANAKAIAFDNCHKIYVLMDDQQVAVMREYEYDPLITSEEMSPKEMYDKVADWFEESCGLRFIQAVYTTRDGEPEFVSIVAQGEDWEYYEND